MIIRNCHVDKIHKALFTINMDLYEAEIITQNGVNIIAHRKNGNHNVRIALRTRSGSVYGSRHSWTGRKGPYACWHVFRDFYRELFALEPNAVVVSSFAKFTAANFEDTYQDTYYTNAGSMMQPVHFGDLCHDCHEGAR